MARHACEPNVLLPQYIDIEELRRSFKPFLVAQDPKVNIEAAAKALDDEDEEYRVLPLFSKRTDHLKDVLSLQQNPYLRCKWNAFLEELPDDYVKIRLYTELSKSKQHPRRMTLNGEFYGVDNKLAPVPFSPDPRHTRKVCRNANRKRK